MVRGEAIKSQDAQVISSAFQGLEFQAVIVAAVDQLPGDDEIVDTNLLDVGLTLATDHLAVTWTGRSTFTDRIAGSKRAVARVHQV